MTAPIRVQADFKAGIFRTPRRAFTDPKILEKEYETIFSKCWLYLAHASELQNPGDFLSRTVARRPILFTRDKGQSVSRFAQHMPASRRDGLPRNAWQFKHVSVPLPWLEFPQ